MGILRCPVCREKFRWDLSTPFPQDCPICDEHIGSDCADDDVCMPSIRSARSATKATDKVYRDMERASVDAAHAAAEAAGVPASEMLPTMAMTNMRDGMKQGDIAAPPLTGSAAALEQHMTQMQQRGAHVGFQGANGLGFSGAVMTGPSRNAGANFQTVLRQNHAERTNYSAIGDNPALELFQPGYQPRARW